MECVSAWQEELRPILLRRMKEDVEDLPEKEEVVVRVQLTKQQRRFYNGIYEKQARLSCVLLQAWDDQSNVLMGRTGEDCSFCRHG